MRREAHEVLGEDAAVAGEAVGLRGGVDAADAIEEALVADVLARRVVVAEQAERVRIGPFDVDLRIEREVGRRLVAELDVDAGVVARGDGEDAGAHERLGVGEAVEAQGVDVRGQEANVDDLLDRRDGERRVGGGAGDLVGAFARDGRDLAGELARDAAQIDEAAERVGFVEDVAQLVAGGEVRHEHEVDRRRAAAAVGR